jgi:hypothetical protein
MPGNTAARSLPLRGLQDRRSGHDDLNAVRTGIGTMLRGLLSDVTEMSIPDEMLELLKRLDRPPPEPPDC